MEKPRKAEHEEASSPEPSKKERYGGFNEVDFDEIEQSQFESSVKPNENSIKKNEGGETNPTYYSEESEEEQKGPDLVVEKGPEPEKVDFVKETFAKFGLNMNLYNPGALVGNEV